VVTTAGSPVTTVPGAVAESTTVLAASTGSGGSNLPRTGGSTVPLVVFALALATVGTAMIGDARRRASRQ
jgi:hypothetical protein